MSHYKLITIHFVAQFAIYGVLGQKLKVVLHVKEPYVVGGVSLLWSLAGQAWQQTVPC